MKPYLIYFHIPKTWDSVRDIVNTLYKYLINCLALSLLHVSSMYLEQVSLMAVFKIVIGNIVNLNFCNKKKTLSK